MAADAHKSSRGPGLPVHDDVAFESSDVKTGRVLQFMIWLGIVIVVSLGVCMAVLRFTESRVARTDAPPPPVRRGLPPALPPEPRLQAQGLPGHDSDPQQDYRNLRDRDREALEKAAWVDEKAGVAQIPIEEAMRIIAVKGLPATRGGAAPRGKEAVKK